jgi:hypothetical protein
MRKNHMLPFIGAIALGMTIFAQRTVSQESSQTQQKDVTSLQGKVEVKGDKITFLTDKGQKSWEITNPEVLKGHAGRYVLITGYVNTNKKQIKVTNVKDDDKHPCGEGGSEGIDCPPPK